MFLMSLVGAFQDTDERFLLGKNCLMMYVAHEKTLSSLCQCVEENDNIEFLLDLLSFLNMYCNFTMDVEKLYRNRKLVPNTFQKLFKKHWDIDLGSYWEEKVIAQKTSVSQSVVIPSIPFMNPTELTKVLEYCFLSATYEKRTKLMDRLVCSLRKHFSEPDSDIIMKLDSVETYIAHMKKLRNELRHGLHSE